MSGTMEKIKDALGFGHSHSSHKNYNNTTAENCPECIATRDAGLHSGSSSTYSTTTTGAMPSSYSSTTTTNTSGLGSTGYTTGTTGYGTTTGTTTHGQGYDNAMTRSEEQLLVGKEKVDTGAAALKKTVVSEHVQTNVPLVQEKVVLQREPINDANRSAAYSGPELKESEHVVTTHAERPVVGKETVAKERVSLNKVAEVVNQPVGGEIRKEHITVQQQGAPVTSTTTTGTTSTTDPLYNKDSTYAASNTGARKAAY